jgi:hypothetical protein
MAHLPIEWMDPMSWRLPSGMALAEFALQTGFLAPLMMRAPKSKKKTPLQNAGGPDTAAKITGASRERVEEGPGHTAAFRENR